MKYFRIPKRGRFMTVEVNRLSRREAVEAAAAVVVVSSGLPWISLICSLVEEGECTEKKKVLS